MFELLHVFFCVGSEIIKKGLLDRLRFASFECCALRFKAQSLCALVEYLSAPTKEESSDQILSKPSPSDIPQSEFNRGLYLNWQAHWWTYEWNTLVPNFSLFDARCSTKRFRCEEKRIKKPVCVKLAKEKVNTNLYDTLFHIATNIV